MSASSHYHRGMHSNRRFGWLAGRTKSKRETNRGIGLPFGMLLRGAWIALRCGRGAQDASASVKAAVQHPLLQYHLCVTESMLSIMSDAAGYTRVGSNLVDLGEVRSRNFDYSSPNIARLARDTRVGFNGGDFVRSSHIGFWTLE